MIGYRVVKKLWW